MESLYIGRTVEIQRTNGRIHSAVISSINWAAQNVTVEWTESDETKGKEVDFGSLYELNPEIFQYSQPVTTPSVQPSNRRIPGPRVTEIPAALHNQNQNNQMMSKSSMRLRGGNNRHTVLQDTTHAIPTANNQANNGIGLPGLEPPSKQQQQQQQQQINNTTANNNINNNKMPRKSCILREVDKIKKQREERRSRQAEQKAEKMELMSAIEPGNPNWEFLGMIREYRGSLDIKPLTASDSVESRSDQICVAVRKRPMNNKELNKKDIDVLTVPNKDMVVVHEPKLKVDLTRYLENHMFRFDYAFDETTDNLLVYQYTAKPLVSTIFEGGMATCFAYGQTGSGKTHTMGGDFHGKSQDSTKGIYALVAQDIFRLQQSPKYRNLGVTVCASYFEIYSGKVFDLLNNKAKLRVLEDAKQQVRVVGLQEYDVTTVNDVLRLIQTGNTLRTSGVTSANNHSSRSHAVFQLTLRKPNKRLHGKYSLIDLAGNERGADTASANRQTRMEGAEINKSLLALKECIRALGRKGAHLPFRVSKLTQVLRDSFIGENSRTCMIAMISPGMQSCENTLNTLRYADRVKELGAENPDVKVDEDDDAILDNGNGDDLALLHNAHEIPDDLFTFHEAVSLLQESEEAILDSHKVLVDEMPKWISKHNNLIKMTLDVDYDVEAYAQELEKLIDDNLVFLGKLREDVSNFRSQLAEEEIISQKIHK